MNQTLPILYSFRRCPYAIRARLAITYASIDVELREVVLRNKPPELLALSAKATVPVLALSDGQVIDQSLAIMYWALSQNDPDDWLIKDTQRELNDLIKWNDGQFKYYLDRYKYADRYPEYSQPFYRQQAEVFISELEQRLAVQAFLCGDKLSLADNAIFPFIRQFAYVDIAWFKSSKYPQLNQWLIHQLESVLFGSIMDKYPAWQMGEKVLIFQKNTEPV